MLVSLNFVIDVLFFLCFCWIIMDIFMIICLMQGKEYVNIIKNLNFDEVDFYEYIGYC